MFVGIRLLLLKLLTNSVLILLTTLFDGIWLDGVYLAVALAAVLVLVNFSVPFVILLLAVPLNIYSLAAFVMLANMIVLGLLGWVVPGFHVTDLQSWLGGSVVVGCVNFIVCWLMYLPALRRPHPGS